MHWFLIAIALLFCNETWAEIENASAHVRKAYRPSRNGTSVTVQIRLFSPSFVVLGNFGSNVSASHSVNAGGINVNRGRSTNYSGINENYGPAINYDGINYNYGSSINYGGINYNYGPARNYGGINIDY